MNNRGALPLVSLHKDLAFITSCCTPWNFGHCAKEDIPCTWEEWCLSVSLEFLFSLPVYLTCHMQGDLTWSAIKLTKLTRMGLQLLMLFLPRVLETRLGYQSALIQKPKSTLHTKCVVSRYDGLQGWNRQSALALKFCYLFFLLYPLLIQGWLVACFEVWDVLRIKIRQI